MMEKKFKTLSEALYTDSDYLTELANKPSMSSYCQEIINATVDINRAAFILEHLEKNMEGIEALKLVRARIRCLESIVSSDRMCDDNCEACGLTYEQGTMGEQIKAFKFVSDILEFLYERE